MNARDKIGRTALHFACRAGKLDIFSALIAHEDTDIDAVTKAGVTPLMMAIESGNIELVALCLNTNLNPFLRDALGRTAMDYAAPFRDVMGYDMRQLIQTAVEQWEKLTSEQERTGPAQQYSAHFQEFAFEKDGQQ